MSLSAEDRTAIQNLAGRYSQALDDGDAEAWASVWTDDGVMEMVAQERWITGDSLRALAAGRDDSTPQARHMPSTFVIDGAGDEASMSSYVTVVRCDDPAKIVFQGRYMDRLRRVGGAWKLAHRTILTDWIEPATAEQVQGTGETEN